MRKETLQEYWLARKHLVDAALAGKEIRVKGKAWAPAFNLAGDPESYEILEPKLTIPWEYIDKRFTWAAMDEYGVVRLFVKEPEIKSNLYWVSGGEFDILGRAILQPEGIDWKKSKIQRPN